MDRKKVLTVRDLLRKTCRRLGRRHGWRNLRFPDEVWTEIADDSDYHRTKRGYMRYRSAKIIRLGAKRWAVARGEKGGSYPADPYDSDIIAIEIDPEAAVNAALVEKVAEAIREGSYFRRSLVVGLADGNVALYQHSLWSGKMLPELRAAADGWLSQDARRDGRYLSLSTLQPIVTSAAKYRPEAARALTDIIVKVLKNS